MKLFTEKYDVLIELLAMAKKKLGSLMFDVFYNIGQDSEWQNTLASDLVKMFYKSRQSRLRRLYMDGLVKLFYEVLRNILPFLSAWFV